MKKEIIDSKTFCRTYQNSLKVVYLISLINILIKYSQNIIADFEKIKQKLILATIENFRRRRPEMFCKKLLLEISKKFCEGLQLY